MTKKNSLIVLITSLILIVASIISVVIYFSLFDKSNESSSDFYVSCENITGYIDNWVDIPVKTSEQDVQLEFKIYDESIAQIANNQIIGLKPGVTAVTITATKNGTKSICNFYFTAKYSSCQFEILPSIGCSYTNKELTVYEDTCQFSISFVDDFGNKVVNPNIIINVDENLTIKKTAFNYLLTVKGNGTITFVFVDYNFTVNVSVIK